MELVVFSANTHETIFTPITAPRVFDQPEVLADQVRCVLSKAYDSDSMVESLKSAAATLVVIVGDDATRILLYTVIYVEGYTDSPLTHKCLHVVIQNSFKNFEV